MKPVVSAFNAWSCTVISCFAIVILSVLGSLFSARTLTSGCEAQLTAHQRKHHSVMGMESDPTDHQAVAASIFITVAIYAGFLVFCGFQAYLHVRASRRGAISLQ